MPKRFLPLTYTDFAVKGGNALNTYILEVVTDSIKIAGSNDPQSGRRIVPMPVNFYQSPTIYSLVEGGWLPPPFVIPANFLVDRNVVSNIVKITSGVRNPELLRTDWWLNFFDKADFLINPVLYALEGDTRSLPSFEEFCCSFKHASKEIIKRFPSARLINYEDIHFQASYQILIDLAERNKREAEFLIRTAPEVVQRHAQAQLSSIQSRILETAKAWKLKSNSLAVLSVISCLYENKDGSGFFPARRIINPTANYLHEDAYNALADMRSLEIFVASLGLGLEPFSLCTSDKAIALLWCGLKPHNIRWHEGRPSFDVSLDEHLFPRLQDSDRVELAKKLSG